MPTTKPFENEEFRVYIIRRADQDAWLADARSGNEVAKLCQWVASKWMKAMATEHSVCSCCDMVFSDGDLPQAFIVLIPTKYDPETVEAKAGAVCPECSQHDDAWLIQQGVHRTGLSPAAPRPGNQIH
jgi:hypothetical protein